VGEDGVVKFRRGVQFRCQELVKLGQESERELQGRLEVVGQANGCA
jgi:hypothetical protein